MHKTEVNFTDPAEVKLHDEMVALVERMLALHEAKNPGFSKKPGFSGGAGFSDAKIISPRERDMLERQIEMTDDVIDRLVYKLYGLTEEEIGIVEG